METWKPIVCGCAPHGSSAEDPGYCRSGTTLDIECVVDQRPTRRGVKRVVNRRRTRVAIGVALALVLLASWLAFDQPLLRARATNFPRPSSAQDGHDSAAADGRLAAAGSTGLAQVVSEPARGDTLARGGHEGVSSDAQSSYSSGAADYAHTEQDGKGRSSAEPSGSGGVRETTGTAGSGSGSSGAVSAVAGSTQAAGPAPNPDVSTSSDALPGPAVGTRPPLVASGRNGTAPQSGPAPSTAPANQLPLNGGQSGPPGGTIGPVVRAESFGSGSNTGPADPDRSGRGTSGPAAGSDVSPTPIPVPVPPSLLLFGASALMLWFVSRE